MTGDDDDKKKLAEQIETLGDSMQKQRIDMIQQTLRLFADSAVKIADVHRNDEWSREWVAMVDRAAADLRTAADRVQVQPLAPHGEVPS